MADEILNSAAGGGAPPRGPLAGEILESNRQFIDTWGMYARRAANGVVTTLPAGIEVTASRVTMPLLNMLFLGSPVADSVDFARRADAAVAYGHELRLPWMLTVCEDWLPSSTRAEAATILGARGVVLSSLATGMVADRLAPPRRPAPPLEIVPVSGRAERIALADLNCAAYGMPLEWGHEALDREEIFAPDVFGFLGIAGGKPVSTATTALVDGRLYVMLVATAAAEERKGYAEAVMRHSLARAAAATGATRTVLHATEAGAPLYASMGYRSVARFTMYGQAH